MNEDLILRWNEKITNEDEVYFLGDFAMNHNIIPRILPCLNRKKLILITGNHDKPWGDRASKWDQLYLDYGFDEIHRTPIIKEFRGISFVLSHIPYDNKDPRFVAQTPKDEGLYNLHGHRHSKLEERLQGRCLDIGVDGHDYYPWSIDEIFAEFGVVML